MSGFDGVENSELTESGYPIRFFEKGQRNGYEETQLFYNHMQSTCTTGDHFQYSNLIVTTSEIDGEVFISGLSANSQLHKGFYLEINSPEDFTIYIERADGQFEEVDGSIEGFNSLPESINTHFAEILYRPMYPFDQDQYFTYSAAHAYYPDYDGSGVAHITDNITPVMVSSPMNLATGDPFLDPVYN